MGWEALPSYEISPCAVANVLRSSPNLHPNKSQKKYNNDDMSELQQGSKRLKEMVTKAF